MRQIINEMQLILNTHCHCFRLLELFSKSMTKQAWLKSFTLFLFHVMESPTRLLIDFFLSKLAFTKFQSFRFFCNKNKLPGTVKCKQNRQARDAISPLRQLRKHWTWMRMSPRAIKRKWNFRGKWEGNDWERRGWKCKYLSSGKCTQDCLFNCYWVLSLMRITLISVELDQTWVAA